jgi:hypothetical protein
VYVKVPKILIDVVHEIRVIINPKYADEFYEQAILVRNPLKKIEEKMVSWGCELNHNNQFKYPNQVSSGHLYFGNGKQLHIRVKFIAGGKYELKGHVEWHGVPHPIRHMMYFDLDYELGYKVMKDLWDAHSDDIEDIKKKYDILI